MATFPLSKILPERQVKDSIKLWLAEDMPNFDIGAVAITNDEKEGHLFVKETAVIAGLPFINEVFNQLNCTVEWKVEEGTKVTSVPSCVAIIRGPVVQILQGERLALNIFSRACGIASISKKFVDISNNNKWKGSVVGTRKTTPGFRLVEKYAMLVGGAGAHRFDLSSMVMLKDNHIDASIVPDKEKAITQAVNQVRKLAGLHMKIEVESRNEKEALAGAAAGADIIMLDNFNSRVACSVAHKIKARYPRVSIEASGNITETNVAGFMGANVDIISTSRLCHGYSAIDVSMKLQPSTPPPDSLSKSIMTTPVAAGAKRPAPASEENAATKAVPSKNGDSTTPVDADTNVPEKRRKTDDFSDAVKTPEAQAATTTDATAAKTTPASAAKTTPASAAKTTPAPAAKSTPTGPAKTAAAVTIKSSPGSTKTTPAKPVNTPTSKTTPSGRPSTGNTNRGLGRGGANNNSSNTANRNQNQNQNQNQNRRPGVVTKNTPPNQRFQGSGNQRSNNAGQNRLDASGNRGSGQGGRQQGQFNRGGQNGRFQGGMSGQSPQQAGRCLMSPIPGSAGPLHQQLALQAAASRSSGMPMRPGGAMGMMRPGMGNHPGRGGGFNNMNSGRPNVTGPNAIPVNGPHGYGGMSGRPNNARDWDYGY